MILDRLVFHGHLEEDEKILYVIHKHWIHIFKPVVELTFVGFLLPWTLFLMGFNKPLFFWIATVWTALAAIRYFYLITDWYADAWILTTMDVIHVEWSGLFHNSAARTNYQDIEGAEYEVKGFWATIFGYGDFTLKISSGNMVIHNCANPQKAEHKVAEIQDEFLNHKGLKDASQLKDLLSEMLATHNKNK
jgi:hypothetical protein